MLGLKKKVVWTAEELSKGFTLRYLSKPAVNYVIENLNFPIPSVSTLESYAVHIDIRRGFFKEIFEVLKTSAMTSSERDRVCVFMYDEMAVSEQYEFDRRHDDILGPHGKMQVI